MLPATGLRAPGGRVALGHPFARLLTRLDGVDGRARLLVAAAAVVVGLLSLKQPLQALMPPMLFVRDFMQEYVMARALADGANPYGAVSALATQYVGPMAAGAFAHPSPHPPTFAVMLAPLALFDLVGASYLWLAVQLACLVAGVALLVGPRDRRGVLWTATLAALLVVWAPVHDDLVYGNVNLLLLCLTAAAWRLMAAGRSTAGGALTGALLLVKPVLWPLAVLLVLRRAWRSVGAAAVVGLAGAGLAVGVLGWSACWSYLTEASSTVTAGYRGSFMNLSLASVGPRLFAGTGAPFHPAFVAPPLVDLPPLGDPLAVGLPLLLVAAAGWWQRRLSFDAAFALAVCVGVAASPVVWSHYLVLALVPLAFAARRLAAAGFPRAATNGFVLAAAVLTVPVDVWKTIGLLNAAEIDDRFVMPAAAAALTLLPLLGLFWLMHLILRLGRADRAG